MPLGGPLWLRIWLRISHDGRPTMAMGG
ncbi:MAG: integrase, partial [Bifidobacterium bifidum]|nr:integrase [Bifidobacterium bifidum]